MNIQEIFENISKHWIFIVLGIIGGFVAVIALIQFFIKTKSEKTIDNTYTETRIIKEELIEIKNILLNSSFDEINSGEYPGITIALVADIRSNTNPGDAYVLDILSKEGNERFSVFQTRYNELCFVVTDYNSESEILKIQPTNDGYQNNSIKLYAFDYREKDNSSFIRIIVNNKEIGKLDINRKLGLQDVLNYDHGTIGATYNELGCSDLLLSFVFVSRLGFSKTSLEKIRNIFFNYLSKVGYRMREVGCKGVMHLENELDWKHSKKKL